ncbi:hypothetical protein GCM10009544_07820 [Streptomyces stramineus]|uniref:DUF7848 domain-containing protein n=1 Tax=Streptomyces stramineus TaxID=173861 RepID=A0ABP3JAQ4_9ACTN
MIRRRFRYVPFTIAQDASAWPEYSAVCVSGEESECGAASGQLHTPAGVEDWMRRHMQATGHVRYGRDFRDYAQLAPSDDADVTRVARGEVVASVPAPGNPGSLCLPSSPPGGEGTP